MKISQEPIINDLTAANIERLALIVEEMGESLQVIGKILRHGFYATDVNTGVSYDNKKSLEMELGQTIHAIEMLSVKDLNWESVEKFKLERTDKLKNYLHFQSQ